ncbi:peptidoglycan hydrolase [Alcanivorax venustensis ISO4]|uniref:Peptidoglycan hydrolase FlgJ n=1 Tax=Alloalcanivorax venustensis ISO4 TaxID=1177184 RepID=A0ABS0AL44_9GAMM|nr:flagellar assembly peptidoglycan hydrolase FlgJ [Alloalcanivorax venustensis]MBF5054025.1 peptidoglycan hydrolase [Alloalcanivorax venustensis ISO4]
MAGLDGSIQGQFALDVQGLDRLKHSAARDPQKQLRSAAEQFEALFLHRMIKSMRDATPRSELTDSSQMRFYQSLFDQQMSQHMAGRGLGLADQLVAQLSGKGTSADAARAATGTSPLDAIPRGEPRRLPGVEAAAGDPAAGDPAAGDPAAGDTAAVARTEPPRPPLLSAANPATPTDFVHQLSEPAREASRRTGMPAPLILAQAALETGWGRREIPTSEGGNSHNLFGIKAGADWKGPTTEVVTHEYINGQRTRVVDRFRVYDSYAEAFEDHGRLISDNPRYAPVLDAADANQAAQALQNGGYATDPAYADKLVALMDQIGGLVGAGPARERVALATRQDPGDAD